MLSFESPIVTPWHSVPVATKFLVVCLASIFLFIFDSVWLQLTALLLVCGLYLVGGKGFFKFGVARVKFLWPILLIIILWHVLTGTTMQGLAIALRLAAIVALSNLLTMTSRLSDLLALLQRALAPLRALGINTRPVEVAVALVVRFTPVLIDKGAALVGAWRVRSLKKPSWRIVFPLSLVAIDDAEHVAEALKARGGTLRLNYQKKVKV